MAVPGMRGVTAALLPLFLLAPAVLAAQGRGSDSAFALRVLPLLEAASPDLAAGRARRDAAAALGPASTARPPAELSLEVENIPDGADLGIAQQMRLLVGAPLSRGGRPRAARSAADARLNVAALELALTERAVAARGWRAFNGTLLFRLAAARLAAEDSLLGQAEEALRARLATGDARYLDVLRLRTERLRVQGDRSLAVTEAREREVALLGLLGDSAGGIPALLDSLVAARAEPQHLAATAAGPDTALVAAFLAAHVAVAQADRDVLVADRGFALTGLAGIQRFQNANNSFVFGPSLALSMPLPFTAGGGTRNIRAAGDLAVAATVADTVAAQYRLAAARRAALQRLAAAEERLAVYNQALLLAAASERDAALSAFRTGQITLLELLDFERALTRAELDRLRAVLAASDARADLDLLPAEQLLGGFAQ